jgi:hypothetical protein
MYLGPEARRKEKERGKVQQTGSAVFPVEMEISNGQTGASALAAPKKTHTKQQTG